MTEKRQSQIISMAKGLLHSRHQRARLLSQFAGVIMSQIAALGPIARIRTRLRRTNADLKDLLTIGDLAIDVTAHEVKRGAKLIALTRLEFDLLVALAKEPGRVFTRDSLLSEVWGYRHSTDTRLVNVHVQRLRSKVEHDPENPRIVTTIRGVGYKAGVTDES